MLSGPIDLAELPNARPRVPAVLALEPSAVLLVPSESSRYEYVVEREVIHRRRRRRMSRRERRRAEAEAEEEERVHRAEQVRERYRTLDERLARIEKYVTSSRYDLDREFRNL